MYSRSSRGVPCTMPTETAATGPVMGEETNLPSATSLFTASCAATKAPVMAAERVPPSACSTSQSRWMVRSPSAFKSNTARIERPIRRWISCVRPLCLPRAASRSLRVWVDARQHAVLGRDPALAAAALVRGHLLLHRGGAQHLGGAELDQHRAFGMDGEAARDADGAQLVGGTAAASCKLSWSENCGAFRSCGRPSAGWLR